MTARGFGWPQAIVIVAMMAFAAFALWLTASKFDSSEIKTLVVLAVGFVTREVLPLAVKLLSPTSELLGRGGQSE